MKNSETGKTIGKSELPMLMSVHDLQSMGMGRSMAYKLLNRAGVPVVKIGERKFVLRDKFMLWLEGQILTTQGEIVDEPEETEADAESTVK